MNNVDNNKLIADFMGAKMRWIGDSWTDYETNWNCLMPAVKKIWNICGDSSKSFLGSNIPKDVEGAVFDALLKVDIKVLYKATIEFIQWSNNERNEEAT